MSIKREKTPFYPQELLKAMYPVNHKGKLHPGGKILFRGRVISESKPFECDCWRYFREGFSDQNIGEYKRL